MTKYFMFSNGSYSDYCVGGLYTCDHEVSESDWDAHYKIYSDECARLAKLIPTEPGNGYRRIYDSDEMRAYQAYRNEYDPEESFQKLHGMVALECAEFWRD